MTLVPQPKPSRDDEIADALEESAEAQDEWAGTLRQIAQRMEALSVEMRRHGAFPIAGSIERERQRREDRAHAERP